MAEKPDKTFITSNTSKESKFSAQLSKIRSPANSSVIMGTSDEQPLNKATVAPVELAWECPGSQKEEFMQRIPKTVIFAGGGMVTQAIKRLLEEEMRLSCRTLAELDIHHVGRTDPTDLAVIMPDSWQQLSGWLPGLEKAFVSCPWLIIADLRIAGLFITSLQMHACTLLSPHASMEEIEGSIAQLTSGSAMLAFPQLLSQFVSNAFPSSSRRMALPTIREFEIGCAISLGLSNQQMAQTLHVEKATIRSHLHHLFQKLRLSHRQELAAYFYLALSPPSPSN